MTPKTLSLAWAAAFLAAFAAGLIPNPIVGPGALFMTNTAHDLVHLVTAVAFLAMAFQSGQAIRKFMLLFGVAYALVGLVGFTVTGLDGEMGMLLGIICINLLDNFLHLALGAGIFFTGRLLIQSKGPDTPSVSAA